MNVHAGDEIFRRFFDAAATPLCIADGNLRPIRLNPAFEALLGWSTEELGGRSLIDLVRDDQGETTRARLRALPAGESIRQLRIALATASGEARQIEATLNRSADGREIFLEARDATGSVERRRHARDIEGLTGVGSWEIDLETRRLYWSPMTFRIHGLDPAAPMPDLETAIGYYAPEARATVAAFVDRVLKKGTPEGFELPLIRADGRRIWVRTTAAIERRDGRAVRVYGTLQDVTEARARRIHLNRLGALAETTGNAVVITDRAGLTLWVNPAFTAATGYTLEDGLGRKPGSFLQCERTDPETAAMLSRAIAAGEGITTEILNRRKDGTDIWLRLDIRPVRDETGEIESFLSIQTDLSEPKATEARLCRAEREAREAREQLLAAVETMDGGFILFDRDDRLVLCNTGYRDTYSYMNDVIVPGIRFEDMLREGVRRGVPPEAVGREEAWIQERLAQHRAAISVVERERPGGRWLRLVERRMADGGSVGLRIDITELKRRQAELEAKNAELSEALAARDRAETWLAQVARESLDWFWEQDAELRFVRFYGGQRRNLSFEPNFMLGMTRDDLVREAPETAASADWDWLAARCARREPFSDFVYFMRAPSGEEHWIRIAGAPFFDEAGAFAGYRGLGSDVTALMTARHRAEEASRAKSDFIAHVSHEIRTPMNAVVGLATILEARVAPTEGELVATIREAVEMLQHMLNDMLDISKIEAGKLELEEIPFDPAEIARRAAALYRPGAEAGGLDFALALSDPPPAWRRGDPNRLLQILNNLLGNAVKFTGSGFVRLSIADGEDGALRIVVADSGIGMTEEEQARMFEPFEQADSSTRRRFGGTGLGMAIVRRLVDAMSGEIVIESRKGVGTKVRLSLPLPRSSPEPAETEPLSAPRDALAGLRVLAADDNATNRVVLRALLEWMGADEVRMVDSGPEAIAALAGETYDVVLLDISMPRMDGIETLARIRQQAALSGRTCPPVLAVTANAMPEQMAQYSAAGFDGHVAKPVRPDTLRERLRQLRGAGVPQAR